MTDRIEPALSAEDWAEARESIVASGGEDARIILDIAGASDIPSAIATLNEALPDSDPRKITRRHVERLRVAADGLRSQDSTMHGPIMQIKDELKELADVLASYLPPE